MTKTPTGNGNEMVGERLVMVQSKSMNKMVGGGNWQVCLKMRKFTWPEFIGNSNNNPGKTGKNLGGGSRSGK